MTETLPFSARIRPHMPNYIQQENESKPAPRRRGGNQEATQPQSARPKPPSTNPNSSRSRRSYRGSRRGKALSPVISNGPGSPQSVCDKYHSLLTEYEREEIFCFPDIYFVGNRSHKINPDPNDKYNQGFDDDTNNYKLIVGDHLAYRFEIISLFGAGAFGQVCRCFDHKNRIPVAVKVIVNTDQMHEQGKIEAQILSKLNTKDQRHIVKAYDFFIFRSHICITFEILGMNLYELSESNDFKPIPARLVRLYALQILSALDQCQRIKSIHCDIKPENILLVPGSNTLVKLIDFGSSCFDGSQKYEYIQSRFYRAPEVLIGIPYGNAMDVWSLALVIVELLIGRPIFPGDDEEEQLSMISELLGACPKYLVQKGKRRKEFFDDEFNLRQSGMTSIRIPGSMNLKNVLQTNDTYLVDFIMRCLTWDPNDRLSAAEAMQHPWIRMKEVSLQTKRDKNLPGLQVSHKRFG